MSKLEIKGFLGFSWADSNNYMSFDAKLLQKLLVKEIFDNLLREPLNTSQSF